MSKGISSMPNTPECGYTDPASGDVQPLPDQVEMFSAEIPRSGPCEIWCDDLIVLPFTVDCRLTFPNGKLTYDKAACVDKSRLALYYMSMSYSDSDFAVFKQCAKIGDGVTTSTEGVATSPPTDNGATVPNATEPTPGTVSATAPPPSTPALEGAEPTPATTLSPPRQLLSPPHQLQRLPRQCLRQKVPINK
ncbi:unnamed protein product [Phytophthora lilii]|uniref:Unnamed protein product n=1 Tax=Phytophthora lilii TaxID=2077276 RepID=A0A9W6TGQ3_9STRA|nr:unnamed protein product [Phytophthora lilii]